MPMGAGCMAIVAVVVVRLVAEAVHVLALVVGPVVGPGRGLALVVKGAAHLDAHGVALRGGGEEGKRVTD